MESASEQRGQIRYPRPKQRDLGEFKQKHPEIIVELQMHRRRYEGGSGGSSDPTAPVESETAPPRHPKPAARKKVETPAVQISSVTRALA
jgi:hypothetical protein